jgi:hypothetical protein
MVSLGILLIGPAASSAKVKQLYLTLLAISLAYV